jgi:hypothetical protein
VDFTVNDKKKFVTMEITVELIDSVNDPANYFGIALVPGDINLELEGKESLRTSHPIEFKWF